jgi:hypothetical protein
MFFENKPVDKALLSYDAMLLSVLLVKAVNLPGKFYKLSRKVLRSPVSIDGRLVVVPSFTPLKGDVIWH